MKTLGKPHYVLNQDFYYWKNDKMNKVSKGQEYTWNGCAYSPKNYDEKLNKGITIGEDFVENGALFDKIKSDKDLSKDFAIIFGIKPREVPSKSSGVEGIKQQLEKYSNMENSKLEGAIDAMKGMARNSGLLPLDSDKYARVGNIRESSMNDHESIKMPKTQTEKAQYKVSFKDDKPPILISENMVNKLRSYDSRSNINGYNTSLNLLWVSDEDTGEMICLDSSSILSIVKNK